MGCDRHRVALRQSDMAVPQGSFLISYSQWMLPVRGTISHLPGHNVVVRKQALLKLGSATRTGTFVCRVPDEAFTRRWLQLLCGRSGEDAAFRSTKLGTIRPYFFHDRNWIWCDQMQALLYGGTSALRAAPAADRGAAFWSRTHRLLARWSASGVRPERRDHRRNSCVRLGMGRNSRRMARA